MKFTEKVLAASKNIYKFKNQNHQRGWAAENQVGAHFKKLNYQTRFQRYKTPFAEIDLVLHRGLDPDLLIEVKTLSHDEYLSFRVSERQKNRLRRAQIWYQENIRPCRLLLAIVCKNKEVLVLEYDFDCLAERVNVITNQSAIADLIKGIVGRHVFVYAIVRSDALRLQKSFFGLRQLNRLPKTKDIVLNLKGVTL